MFSQFNVKHACQAISLIASITASNNDNVACNNNNNNNKIEK